VQHPVNWIDKPVEGLQSPHFANKPLPPGIQFEIVPARLYISWEPTGMAVQVAGFILALFLSGMPWILVT